MHLIVAILMVMATWKWGTKEWRSYHPTMLFFSSGNLMYQFLTNDYLLWKFIPEINYILTNVIYCLIVFPLSALFYLHNFPAGKFIKKIIYILKWIVSYGFVEFIYSLLHKIEYGHGWNIYWSILFNSIMFPMLLLNHKKPITSYVISIGITITFLWLFNVPVASSK